jgi:hypothetical protein
MSLQESFNRVENPIPFGFKKEKVKRTLPLIHPTRVRTVGRGFKGMEPRKRKKAQSAGGKKAHKNPKRLRCHQYTSEEARHHALIRWGKLPKGTPFTGKRWKD